MVIYTFWLFQGKRIYKFLLLIGTISASLLFMLLAILIVFENMHDVGVIIGLCLMLISSIFGWDMVLYRVQLTANQLIMKRLIRAKRVFNLWDIQRKMELDILVGGSVAEWRLFFFVKDSRYKIRHANSRLVSYLQQIGFVIPDHEKLKW